MSGAMEGDYWGMGDRRDNSPYIPAWWGGNLRGVRDWPIKLNGSGNSQIVYSPHDYGPSVYDQTWFAGNFTEQTLLDDYWYETWAYINEENIAPLLIGEWGGHMDGGKNQKWMTLLRDYMIKHHINHTFWCLNTNSGDTGGLWSDFSYSLNAVTDKSNGTTIKWEESKYALMEKALWQTQSSGKYIGLDHQIPLGINGKGISLSEYYSSYANSEGSNLDGGTKGQGNHGGSVTIKTDTTEKDTTTTTTTTTTSSDTTLPYQDDVKFGDVDCNGKVQIADAVLLARYCAEDTGITVTAAGKLNANCYDSSNDALTTQDVASLLMFLAGIEDTLPIQPS